MKTYLQEAFQAMNLLEGEDFSLTNASVKDILDFKDNDEELNILSITDPDTTEEDDLKDSYVGSVILECEVCHSPIFKNVEDVIVDEDSDLANIEDECPICHSNDGFTIIGQVAPYQEEPELEVEIEDKEVSDDEIEDYDDDIVDDDDIIDDDEEIKESLEETEEEKEDELEESLTEADSSAAELLDDEEDEFADISTRNARNVYDSITSCLYGPEFGYGAKNRRVTPDKAKGEHTYKLNTVVPDRDGNIVVWQPTMEDLKFAAKVGRYFKLNDGVEFEGPIEEPNKSNWKAISSESTNEKIDLPYRVTYFVGHLYEHLREGFEKVDLEMEDKIIHVSEEEKDSIPEAEMVTPVSNELETELLEDNTEEPIDTEMEDEPMIDEPALDDLEAVDSTDDSIDLAADDDEIDYDIDDFEEDDFDELGESYLKEVYDNVNGFKTSKVSLKNEQLIVEGIIKFNSGKSKNTQFIFEAKDATKTGSVRFVGENKQISRGKKAFELRGKMQGSKFIAESLNYNYRAKNSDGQSTRLYGTVKTTKH